MAASAPEATLAPLDVTLSPKEKLARRDSLEKSLQQRPDAQQLKDHHILLDTNAAPALQAAQLDLDRQRRTDELKKGLDNRPDRGDLVERNILHGSNTTVAPSLVSTQRELQKQMRKDSLEKALASRPAPSHLVKEGILERDELPEGVLVDDEMAKE